MAFKLMSLPFSKDALAPHISAETLEYHHGKHHNAYVTKLNGFIEADPSLAGKSLEQIIQSTSGGVFNNAAQVFNHDFYWHSLSPNGGGEPTGRVAEAIKASFGGFAQFKDEFTKRAANHFASGWVWLIQQDGKLAIWDGHDADTPIRENRKPVLTIDVWEHAYYVDRRNDRGAYINAFWNLVNWDFVAKNLG